ncbi:transglycosylase SLT domain-containing protein [Lonepinella koalarum]|uniref:Soluble lytic murein transglycosylase n=1 Tax=Lonepinella koalarum TaxID=53417 RepID=A0A4R1KUR5_9PAST|nr:transglycosylase SLT domain-containing protein [Lonepinella koalarum]MDH2927485.1 lytic murein transglycosylase [Lonepinella koalarum]TCK68373.1 soluble lytic murein transglycosylase [Lonepinella koalarum]TFJ89627.1 lytic murein transglycosylase [Lonepinella koalarum]TYG35439.1 transglycosylase SLT domain-containing protein [Lonepinella koalarum]
MKSPLLKLTLLSLFFALPSVANTPDLQKQREIYRKISEMLAISQSQPTQQLANQLLQQIPNYPLVSYAEYQLLNANKSQLSLQQIEDYQAHQPNPNFANRLKIEWLKQRVTQQDWATITTNSAKLPQDTATQCIVLQAEQAQTEQKAIDEKTQQKNTAVLPQDKLEQLWLTGKSLPSQCDPLLAQWQAQGGLTPDLAKQRAVLAFEQANGNLLKHLQQQSTDNTNKQWMTGLFALFNNPLNLTNYNTDFAVAKLTKTDSLNRRILLAIMPAYIKKLNENQIDPIKHFAELEQWAKDFQLTQHQLTAWKLLYLAQFFDSENPAVQQWRDEQLTQLKDDKLTERRIRLAIREKAKFKNWLDLLSEQTQQKEEWQYWIAQSAPKTKKQQILTALSTQRSFYAMLAAKDLGVVYRPNMLDIKTSGVENADKKTVEQRFAQILARITELRYFNDDANMNSEWTNLLKGLTQSEQIDLADYANKQSWYDLSIEATIQAKAWSYLSLRLPNAYTEWFDLHLQGKQIRRTFAMAIARQESAFRPKASSSANARGLMQLLPSTAKLTAQQTQLPYNNEQQLFDPFYNIMLGTAHLQQLYDKYGDNRILIAAAYNAGANRVDRWLAKANGTLTMAEFVASIPFYETRGYVQNVLAYDSYYQILQQQPQYLFSLKLFTKAEKDRLY